MQAQLKRKLKQLEKAKRPDPRAMLKAAAELDACVIPPEPRLLADDTTMEKLAMLLAEHNGTMAVVAPEGSLFKITAGLYTRRGEPNFELLLRGWSGEPYTVDRITRDSVLLPRVRLSIVMAVQPSLLGAIMEHQEYRGRGLLARFLMATPPSTIGTRTDEPDPIVKAVLHRWMKRLIALLARTCRADTPGELSLSPDAYAEWRTFYVRTEEAMRESGALFPLRDWGSKCPGQVVRIAALLHLFRQGNADPLPPAIPADLMTSAIALGRYFRDTAVALYQPLLPSRRDLHRLLGWLARKQAASISLRDVKDNLDSKSRRGDEWREVLDDAEALGFLRPLPAKERGPEGGRSPSPRWSVHPQLLENGCAGSAGFADKK
jgi:hypothetical protein